MYVGSYCAPSGAIVYCQPQLSQSDAIAVTIDACAAAYARAELPFPVLYDVDCDERVYFNCLDGSGCVIQIEPGPLTQLSSYDPITQVGRLISLV